MTLSTHPIVRTASLVAIVFCGAASIATSPPCNDQSGGSSTLETWHFENEPGCPDALCDFTASSGTATRTDSFQSGEHGMHMTDGTVVSRGLSVSLEIAGAPSNGPRQEFIEMTARCDPGASLQIEEVITETVLASAPDAGVDSGTFRRDAGTDPRRADVISTDAEPVDAAPADDAETVDVAEVDATESDAGVTVGPDAETPVADAGSAATPNLPRLRLGTATLQPSETWTRLRGTFQSRAAMGTVTNPTLTNLRISVTGTGTCTVDDVEFGVSQSPVCR